MENIQSQQKHPSILSDGYETRTRGRQVGYKMFISGREQGFLGKWRERRSSKTARRHAAADQHMLQ